MTSFASTLASGGIDEDYVRAQAMIESHWHQDCAAANGGNGCSGAGDLNNPAGCTNGLPVAPLTPDGQFCALQGFGGIQARNQYDSWLIVQNKVYYEWMTWPMMEQSTSFAVDFRYAEMRGCVNGDQCGYYHSEDPRSATDYENAVIAATINPSRTSSISDWTNLQYLAYGCIETHFTGSWFDGLVDSYLDQFLSDLSTAPWPGGNKTRHRFSKRTLAVDVSSRLQQNGGDKNRHQAGWKNQNGLSRRILPAECGSRAFQRFHNHARMIPNATSPANANAASFISPAGIGAASRY